VKCCGVADDDAAGTELDSSSVERIAVNTGTVSILPGLHTASVDGWAGPTVGRPGWGQGGAAVVCAGRRRELAGESPVGPAPSGVRSRRRG